MACFIKIAILFICLAAMVAARILAERNNCQYDLHYPLVPYRHQVGGHTAVFQLDNNHICKPINESELNFYKTMPSGLRQWVPKFCYEIEVVHFLIILLQMLTVKTEQFGKHL